MPRLSKRSRRYVRRQVSVPEQRAALAAKTAKAQSLEALYTAAAKCNVDVLAGDPDMNGIVAVVAHDPAANANGRVLGAALHAEAAAAVARNATIKATLASAAVTTLLSHQCNTSFTVQKLIQDQCCIAEDASDEACQMAAVATACAAVVLHAKHIKPGTDTAEHAAAFTAAARHIACIEKTQQHVKDSVNKLLQTADDMYVQARQYALTGAAQSATSRE